MIVVVGGFDGCENQLGGQQIEAWGVPLNLFERYSLIFPFTLFFFPVLPLFLKKMGSINSNNCLSFPLLPTNPSFSSSSSNSSNHRLLQSPNFTQPLLSLQNHHEISPYAHDPASFPHSTYSHYGNNTHPFYGGGGDSSGGYLGSALGMGCTSGDEYALVKVDYDMPNSDGGGYGSWSEDSVQGSNNGGF